jgi:hypothetical protein
MADVIPSEKNMFRLIIRSRAGQMTRGKRNGPGPRQPRNWLRQVGIVAASLVFLPVALFSVAVFVGLFLVILVAAIAYGLWLRSGLQRMESHQVIDGDYEIVSDEDNQQKLPKGEGSAQQRKWGHIPTGQCQLLCLPRILTGRNR